MAEGSGRITKPPEIPLWVLTLGAVGFVLGILTLGERTILTVGSKITKLTPSRSFAVQLGTAISVLSSTVLGLAVSTSHCLVGSLIGIGLASQVMARLRGGGGGDGTELDLRVLGKIALGWAATIPLAMVVSVVLFEMTSPLYATHGHCKHAQRHHG